MPESYDFEIEKFRASFGQESLSSIGLMVAAASATEHTLHLQCQRLLSHPGQVSPLALSVLSGAKCNVLLSQIRSLVLWHIGDSSRQAEILGILKDIGDLYGQRSQIVHGFMQGSRDGVTILRVNVRNGKTLPNLKRSDEFISQLAQGLLGACAKLDKALNDAGVTRLPERFG